LRIDTFWNERAQVLEPRVGARALEHLGDEGGAGLERLAHGVERELEEVDRRGLVGRVDAGDVGRDVRDDQVELAAAQPAQQLLDDRLVGEVALDEIDVVGSAPSAGCRWRAPCGPRRSCRLSTCDQPPGAEPRSMMRMPGRISRSFSFELGELVGRALR
jgi:hypothetical protein